MKIQKFQKGKSLFNKEKILHRVPGDALGYKGIGGPTAAVFNYLFKKDNNVDSRLEEIEQFQEKYKDRLQKDPNDDATYEGLTPKEIEELCAAQYFDSIKVHEDAKRLYLGYPQKYNSFELSKYKPTIGKSNKPYQLNDLLTDTEFENVIYPAWMAWKGDYTFTEPGILFKYGKPEVTDVNRIEDYGKTALLKDIPHLENATLSEGFDNKGQYLSLYDVWDYNTKVSHKNGDNVGKFIGGKPFEIYQRYYLDDWFDIPEENRGNPYIVPSMITATKHKNGGILKRIESGKSGIHIKPENRGKFTALKKRTGKSSTWYKEHGTPAQKKMATFALNAAKWNHKK